MKTKLKNRLGQVLHVARSSNASKALAVVSRTLRRLSLNAGRFVFSYSAGKVPEVKIRTGSKWRWNDTGEVFIVLSERNLWLTPTEKRRSLVYYMNDLGQIAEEGIEYNVWLKNATPITYEGTRKVL